MRNIDSLKNSRQFKEVYANGKSFANKLLVLYVLFGQEKTQIGISVSKKVGNSVVRHRVTRLIRESFLAYKDLLPEGVHLVVVARYTAADKKEPEIEEAFGHLLKVSHLV